MRSINSIHASSSRLIYFAALRFGLSCGHYGLADQSHLDDLIWHDGKFFGIDWSVWKVIGWLGNAVFFSRFLVQWYATEKKKQVVVPQAFWWLSLVGSLTVSVLLHSPAGFRVHLCLRLHLDSLHAESDHPLSPQEGAHRIARVAAKVVRRSRIFVRTAARSWRTVTSSAQRALVAGGQRQRTMPYFFRIGWKSGWAWP